MFTFFQKMINTDVQNIQNIQNRELLKPLKPLEQPKVFINLDDVFQKMIIVDNKISGTKHKLDDMEKRIIKNEQDINLLKTKNRCIIS